MSDAGAERADGVAGLLGEGGDGPQVGRTASAARTVTQADVEAFAAVSGDRNPVHLDEAYAAGTAFKGRVAHGMLAGGWISALLAQELPGAVYVSQRLDFRRAIRPGDEVVTDIEVTAVDPASRRVTLATRCRVKGKLMVDGEAVALLPRPPRG